MMSRSIIQTSKFLSLILRHYPGKIGITLDESGWVAIDDLLSACARNEFPLTLEELRRVVETSDKKRFAFSDDGLRIRASQGHSVEVDLNYAPAEPPEELFHGTADRFLASIMVEGLVKRDRHHVHLSPDEATAVSVGGRHGRPVVLRIGSGAMHREGIEFFCSTNGVWLTDHVPVRFLEIIGLKEGR